MSYSFDGSNDRLKGQFTAIYNATPMTMACFISIAAFATSDVMFNVGNSSTTANDSNSIRCGTTPDIFRAHSLDAASNNVAANSPSSPVTGTWTPIVAKFTAANDRRVYVTSVGNTDNNTGSITVTDAIQFIQVGENLQNGNDFAGKIAEVAIWSSALGDANIISYMAGNPASGISPDKLFGYWPLSSNNATQTNQGTDSGGSLTVTGATFSASHPTITGGASVRRRRGALLGMGR